MLNKPRKHLPWGLTILFAIVAIIGWQQVLSTKKKTKELQKELDTIKIKANTQRKSETKNDRQEIEGKEIEKRPERVGARTDYTSGTTIKIVGEQQNEAQLEIADCLANPAVIEAINSKASDLSDDLAAVKVKEKLDTKREENLEEVYEYIDKSEAMVSNGVNNYIETYDIDPNTAEKLHQIIKDGYNNQRDILARLQADEITEREAKDLGAESQATDKEAIVELLGEEGATDLKDVIIDEYKD